MSGPPLRPTLGLFALNMRLNRRFWVMNVFNGLGLPLIVQFAFGQRMDEAGRTRLLIGNVLLGVLLLTLRKTTLNLTFDRVFGARRLLATTGVTRGAYVMANALDALSMAILPLGAALIAILWGGVPAPTSWAWVVPYLVGSVAFLMLAGWLGAGAGNMPSMSLQVNLVVMVAIAFCPLTYPAERVPDLLGPLVLGLPPSLAAEGMARGWDGSVWMPGVLDLVAWSGLLAMLAQRRFRWEST